MATAVIEKTVVLPFGIEIDHPRNADVKLQCIPGVRLRSAIDGTKAIISKKDDDETKVPVDQVRALGSFPKTPGLQVHVNPAELTYMIIDPLHNNEELCLKVHRWFSRNSAFRTSDKINGCPPQEGSLDKHRMKSLCRELFWLVEADEAKKAKGVMPTMKDIEELPGNFLLNPGSTIRNSQPMFEKDLESWIDKIGTLGG